MQVQEVMTRGAECVTPGSSVQEAARLMRDLDVGALPVFRNDLLVGMVTDRDITVRAIAEGCDPRTTTLQKFMDESSNPPGPYFARFPGESAEGRASRLRQAPGIGPGDYARYLIRQAPHGTAPDLDRLAEFLKENWPYVVKDFDDTAWLAAFASAQIPIW
jgi:CBS domain-containing protein